MTKVSGLFIWCATPAVSLPTAAMRSARTSLSDSSRSASSLALASVTSWTTA